MSAATGRRLFPTWQLACYDESVEAGGIEPQGSAVVRRLLGTSPSAPIDYEDMDQEGIEPSGARIGSQRPTPVLAHHNEEGVTVPLQRPHNWGRHCYKVV